MFKITFARFLFGSFLVIIIIILGEWPFNEFEFKRKINSYDDDDDDGGDHILILIMTCERRKGKKYINETKLIVF